MKTNSFIFLVAAMITSVALVSCGSNGNDNSASSEGSDESISDIRDSRDHEHPGMSHFADTLTTGMYHQMILDAIAKGDKEMFAEMVCYPLKRNYPLPDIEDRQQMVGYFDTIFDKPFRKRIAQLDSNSWEQMGLQGWMILDGEIWDTEPYIVVNHTSPLEKRHAAYLTKKDKARLHPSLRGSWEPFDCYHLEVDKNSDFEFEYARIDVSTDNKGDEEPVFRIALFKKGAKASDTPAVVMMGKHIQDGTSYYETFTFETEEECIEIHPRFIEDGLPCFMMGRKTESDYDCFIPCKSQMQPF